MLKAIHAQEERAAARQKAEQVSRKLQEMKLADAAALVVLGNRRDAVLLRVSPGALALFENQQPAGAHFARSAAKNESGGSVPGRQIGFDVSSG